MTGPDGTLWVCDMYRHVIEHPQWIPEAWQARLNLSAGHDRGRIYRIRPKGRFTAAAPNLSALTPGGLVQELRSSNGWRRDTAQRLLTEQGRSLPDAVVTALAEQARSETRPVARVQSLWTLLAVAPEAARDAALWNSFLQSSDPELVIQGIRAYGSKEQPEAWPQLAALRDHPHPRVRFELALAAGDAPQSANRSELLSSIAVHDHADPWIQAAVLSSTGTDAPGILRRVLAAVPASPTREKLVEGLVSTSLGDDPAKGAVAVLSAIVPKPGEAPADWQLAALASCLDGLSRRRLDLASLSDRNDPETAAIFQRVRPVMNEAVSVAEDPAAATTARVTAIRLLGRGRDRAEQDKVLLERLLSPRQPAEIQIAASERLAALGVAETLLGALRRVSPQVQAAVEAVLLQQPGLTKALLKAISTGELPADQLSAATRSALLNHRDAEIRASALECLGDQTVQSPANIAERVARVAALTGDPGRGQALFQKRCSTCHRHHGVGVDVGPQLGALQNKSADFLLTSVLDVNRSVEPRYRSCSLLLVDGRQQVGLVTDETATSLTLVTADGRKQSVLRRDIEELTLGQLSFMPEGLDKDLSDADLADLISFLQRTE
jgi:putative heme-binding domain-containing protein